MFTDSPDLKAQYASAFAAAERLQTIGMPIGYPDGTLRPDEPLTGARLIFAVAKIADYMEVILDATYVESRATAARSVVHVSAGNSCGAGVFVSADGLVITAHHVVAGAKSLAASFPAWDDHATPDLEVLVERPEVDLALCRVYWPAMRDGNGFPRAPMAVSDDEAKPGRPVWAIGSPYGEAGRSSLGTIGNVPQVKDYYTAPQVLLSVSGFINPGNSGGGLFALDGSLLGVVVMKYTGGAEGMAYAVPISEVQKTLKLAKERGVL